MVAQKTISPENIRPLQKLWVPERAITFRLPPTHPNPTRQYQVQIQKRLAVTQFFYIFELVDGCILCLPSGIVLMLHRQPSLLPLNSVSVRHQTTQHMQRSID